MQYKIFIFILLASLSIQCNKAKFTRIAYPDTVFLNKSDNSKKIKKTDMDTVKIIPFRSDYTAKVGQIVEYSYTEHVSVGITADYNVSDAKILKFVKKEKVYNTPPPKSGPMPSGGDKAISTYVFEVIAVGTVELRIEDNYRGTVEKERTFKIVVE